jgi:hypothetical protein
MEGDSSSSLGLSSSETDACADGKRRLKLQPFYQHYFVANRTDGYRLRLVAEEACQMPKEVFRFLRRPADAQGNVYDEFTGVCSSADLEEFPVDEPGPADDPAVFRSAEVDLVFESQHRAEEAMTIILAELTALKETLDAQDVLDAQPAVWIGDAP